MKNINLDYGNSKISFSLPKSSVVVEYGKTYEDPPIVDPISTTKEALNNPLNFSPLKDLAGPNRTAVIVFPDRVKGGAHEFAHRKVSIPLIIEELISGGCKIENISLVCAQGLHRKNTYEEWLWYLGPEIVNPFWPDRIINHDAEDLSLLELGQDEMGNTVQTNKFVANADIPILIGHCAANPYGGFSGGYKMLVTGLSGQNSIKSHHTPKTMHRGDWLGGAINSHMRNQFQSIGEHIERKINKNFFAIDAVVGQKSQILSVKAGKISEVEKAFQQTLKQTEDLELKKMLSSEEDQLSAMLQINPGAGGTESNEWAGILMRMYIMWGESNGYKVREVDFQAGDVAGVKSVTLEFEGPLAYGFLKSENGVHRLVRISPFDSGGRRHTSFASVYVYPVVDESIKIEINPAVIAKSSAFWHTNIQHSPAFSSNGLLSLPYIRRTFVANHQGVRWHLRCEDGLHQDRQALSGQTL